MTLVLLDLPNEILALIIKHVVLVREYPPAFPCETNRIIYQDMKDKAYEAGNGRIFQEETISAPKNLLGVRLSLLLTNRLLSAITADIVRRFSPINPRCHKLDISLRDELDLFPTWISIPTTTNRIDELKVHIRLFGHVISHDQAQWQRTSSSRHKGYQWSFYRLLERYLYYGPVTDLGDNTQAICTQRGSEPSISSRGDPWTWPKRSHEDRDMAVKVLAVNVSSAENHCQFPPDASNVMWQFKWHTQHRGFVSTGLDAYATPPEWVAGKLQRQIRELLLINPFRADWSRVLYERVGRIQILLDGELYHEFLLSELLHDMTRLVQQMSFLEWKRDTIQRRQALGF